MFRKLLFLIFLITSSIPSYTDLQRASYEYLANTQKEAFEVSRDLIPDGGKPGNICGPLSIQILKDAGYVDPQIPTKSFWFLRPFDTFTQENILEPAFPKKDWHWYFFKDSITKFDFEAFPLLPGDFIFLPYNWTCGGTFSHIFVINRVDEFMNPYTVTNHQTSEGWKISELLVYDYTDSGKVTYFDILTDRRNTNTVGTTGFCGFYLWRKKGLFDQPLCSKSFCPE